MYLHVFLHALLDTLKILPFLLLVFVAIAVIEERVDMKKHVRLLGGRFAPLVGSVTGVIPQCGFSVMSVKLFQERYITIGTLLSVFVSTSDEAVSLLLSQGKWQDFLLLCLIKLVIGCIVGYTADAIFKKKDLKWEAPEEVCHSECCKHGHGTSKVYEYFVHPLIHCLETALYVLIVNFALGIVVEWVGEENLSAFMTNTTYIQPLITSLVGLIPNCASSVLLVEVFVTGNITFGALVAGLVSNAGVGLALLLKDGKNIKRNLIIVLILYFAGVIFGELITLLMI